MKNPMLEAGRILNTHGVRGELKVDAWLDDPAVFSCLSEVEISGRTYAVRSARVQGRFALQDLVLSGKVSVQRGIMFSHRIRKKIFLPEDGKSG